MTRYFAIDYGRKRIGLAVSDAGGTIASPLRTVPATGRMEDDVRAVLAAAETYGVDAFVVGLPLNMDGTEGEQARVSRRFGEALARAADRPAHYWDERLSSFAAGEMLLEGEFTRKKKKARIDSVAAQVILRGFLESPNLPPSGER